jgi:hypothetical protein
VASEVQDLVVHAQRVTVTREAALSRTTEGGSGWRAQLYTAWKQADVWSAMRRTQRADRLYDALGDRRAGMVEASKLAATLVADGKM